MKKRTAFQKRYGCSNKYHSKQTCVDGIKFDSKKEATRYCELKLLQRAGEIKDLQRQVRFELIPSQRIDGRIVERPISYIADFVYTNKDGQQIVEDTKGIKTREYIIKRKLMLYIKGVQIVEI